VLSASIGLDLYIVSVNIARPTLQNGIQPIEIHFELRSIDRLSAFVNT